MESLESLKDCLIANEIQRITSLTREDLERELIEFQSRQIESLEDLASVLEYGEQRTKN